MDPCLGVGNPSPRGVSCSARYSRGSARTRAQQPCAGSYCRKKKQGYNFGMHSRCRLIFRPFCDDCLHVTERICLEGLHVS